MEVHDSEGPLYQNVLTYCPACQSAHPFTVKVYQPEKKRPDGTDYPIWSWNGSLESPTFEPSMLCYSTVHRCAGEHHPQECPGDCGSPGHLVGTRIGDRIAWKKTDQQGERVLGHNTPHTQETPYGNCHSYLRDGVWDFLGDSAHQVRGKVPMVPLPDWLAGDDEPDEE